MCLVLVPCCLLAACEYSIEGEGRANEQSLRAHREAKANDPRLNAAHLRAVQPCALIGKLPLDRYGHPHGRPDPYSVHSCEQQVDDKGDVRHVFRLSLGEPVIEGVDQFASTVAGLPADIDTDECEVTVYTDKRAKVAVQVVDLSVGDDEGSGKRDCAHARTVASKAVRLLRGDPPKFHRKGTVALVDPCGVLEQAAIRRILGHRVDGDRLGFEDCTWRGPQDGELSLGFGEALKPKHANIDLGGGVRAARQSRSTHDSCAIEWAHRPVPGHKVNEGVTVELTDAGHKRAHVCGRAVKAAKAVRKRLPHG